MAGRAVIASVVVLAAVLGLAAAVPDLTLDAGRLQGSLGIITRSFSTSSCAYQEGCVTGTGPRRLLQFDTVTPNVGTTDLYLGPPGSDPGFIFDSCHSHYHWVGYAKYNMFDQGGAEVTQGRKQAFCLLDSSRYWAYTGGGSVPPNRQYHCGNQGISVGWQDVYGRGLDCQWIDITDVPNGNYNLRVELNAPNAQGVRRISESRYDNNIFNFAVTVTGSGAGAGQCQIGAWSAWTLCSVDCGGGVRTRTRNVDGANCPTHFDSEACNTQACGGSDDPGTDDAGGSTDDGGNSGGGGNPTSQDGRCGANSPLNAVCPVGQCCSQYGWCGTSAAHCAGTDPSTGGDDDPTDDGGSPTDDGGATNDDGGSSGGGGTGGGGQLCTGCWFGTSGFCQGDNTVCYDYFPGTTICPGNTLTCGGPPPVEDHDCQLSPWTAWGDCSATCGGGTQIRRKIVEIPQSGTGRPCAGPLVEERDCNTDACGGGGDDPTPVDDKDCIVSAWAGYSACDVECGGGNQVRRRTVVTPPEGNGAACPVLEESRTCNTHTCSSGGDTKCHNCFPGTDGECQSYNSVCWSLFEGTDKCPPGTSKCVEVGSVDPDPTVEVELTVANMESTEALGKRNKKLKEIIARKLNVDPNTIEFAEAKGSVTRDEHDSGADGHRRLHGGHAEPGSPATDIKLVIKAPQRYGSGPEATEVAGNMQKIVGDGALLRALNSEGIAASTVQMDTDKIVVLSPSGEADHTPTAAQQAAAAHTGSLSALAVALIAVGAGVLGAGIAAGIMVVRMKRRRSVRGTPVAVRVSSRRAFK